MSSPEGPLVWPLRFGGRGHLGISRSRNHGPLRSGRSLVGPQLIQ